MDPRKVNVDELRKKAFAASTKGASLILAKNYEQAVKSYSTALRAFIKYNVLIKNLAADKESEDTYLICMANLAICYGRLAEKNPSLSDVYNKKSRFLYTKIIDICNQPANIYDIGMQKWLFDSHRFLLRSYLKNKEYLRAHHHERLMERDLSKYNSLQNLEPVNALEEKDNDHRLLLLCESYALFCFELAESYKRSSNVHEIKLAVNFYNKYNAMLHYLISLEQFERRINKRKQNIELTNKMIDMLSNKIKKLKKLEQKDISETKVLVSRSSFLRKAPPSIITKGVVLTSVAAPTPKKKSSK